MKLRLHENETMTKQTWHTTREHGQKNNKGQKQVQVSMNIHMK